MRIWKVSRSVCCFAALILAITSGCAPEAASEPTAQLTSGLLQVTGTVMNNGDKWSYPDFEIEAVVI